MEAVWKALSDPTRRRLLDLLREAPRTTGELCGHFEVSRFAVMKHLGVLQEANLVSVERRGRERWNHLNAVPLQQVFEDWVRPWESLWASSLLAIKHKSETRTGERDMSDQTSDFRTVNIFQSVDIAAPPVEVFSALTEGVGNWWGTPFLARQEARDLVIEPRLGGYFQEIWSNGEGVIHAKVTIFGRDRSLELTGRMGMTGAVAGVVNFDLEETKGGTRLVLHQQAVGCIPKEIEANYNEGWQVLLADRLKRNVETGEVLGVRAA